MAEESITKSVTSRDVNGPSPTMGVISEKPSGNGFVRAARKLYHPVGFTKGYNFVLWFIFAGALMGFSLSRMPYMNFDGVFCSMKEKGGLHAGPGECFYYRKNFHERVGIILHLVCILPAGFLVCFQFVPKIRHVAIIVHRINGYAVILLSVAATIGALMISRHAFGGDLPTQALMGVLAIMFIGSMAIAYINIKRLQIEQHRAWMLRAWFYAAVIITLRIIQVITAIIITSMGTFYSSRPCDQIFDSFNREKGATLHFYPECAPFFSGENLEQQAVVKANFDGDTAIETGVALGVSFAMAGWLALAMHAIGIEVYLRLTPGEHERLRNFSYQRQLEAGMKNPGRAGLTADRLGDGETWVPKTERGAGLSQSSERSASR